MNHESTDTKSLEAILAKVDISDPKSLDLRQAKEGKDDIIGSFSHLDRLVRLYHYRHNLLTELNRLGAEINKREEQRIATCRSGNCNCAALLGIIKRLVQTYLSKEEWFKLISQLLRLEIYLNLCDEGQQFEPIHFDVCDGYTVIRVTKEDMDKNESSGVGLSFIVVETTRQTQPPWWVRLARFVAGS
jgi:hypothetical protein